jgi:hypothetical protein
MQVGQIIFVVAASIAGGLLSVWMYARRTKQQKNGGRRRF